MKDTYRGWTIIYDPPAIPWRGADWRAAGPNYDAWTEGEGEWADNGEKAEAATREALLVEIDAWFDEHGGDAMPEIAVAGQKFLGVCVDCVDGICTMNCSSAVPVTDSEWIAASIWAGVFPAKADALQVLEWRASRDPAMMAERAKRAS